MRAAGAIILGKTNVAQLLLYHRERQPRLWPHEQSLEPRTLARRQQRRPGGHHRGGRLATGLGNRHRRQHPRPRDLLRHRGDEADGGPRRLIPAATQRPSGQRAIVSQIGVLARTADDAALAILRS